MEQAKPQFLTNKPHQPSADFLQFGKATLYDVALVALLCLPLTMANIWPEPLRDAVLQDVLTDTRWTAGVLVVLRAQAYVLALSAKTGPWQSVLLWFANIRSMLVYGTVMLDSALQVLSEQQFTSPKLSLALAILIQAIALYWAYGKHYTRAEFPLRSPTNVAWLVGGVVIAWACLYGILAGGEF